MRFFFRSPASLFLILFFAGSFVSLTAQTFPADVQRTLDSLGWVIRSKSHDTLKVRALLDMADIYVLSNADTSLKICQQVKEICERIGYKRGLGGYNNLVGYIFHERGNDDSAMYYFSENVKIDLELGDVKNAGASLHNIGAIYHQKGDAVTALHYYYKALAIRDRINDQKGILSTTYNIATLLYNQDQKEKAIAYYFRCLKIARVLEDKEFISQSITGIATVYRYRLAALYRNNASPDSINTYRSKTLLYYNSALQHDKQSNFMRLYAADLNALGITYRLTFFYLKDQGCSKDSLQAIFDKAIGYFEKSLELSQKHNYKTLQAYSLQYMAELYLQMEDIGRAESLALKSFHIAEEVKSPENLMQSSKTLYRVYGKKGDYKNALAMHEQHIFYRDSLANQETRKAALKKQYEYESRQKEQENLLLLQKTEIQQLEISRKEYALYGLVCIIVLIVIVSSLFVRQSRIVSREKTMKLEQRLLRSQMNPHFIFNALIAIQSFIYRNEPKESGKYLASFAKLVRAILENSRKEYISLDKEIQWLENYLKLQQLRFEDKFEYSIHVSDQIHKETTFLPPMLTQPAIENALEHGLKHIDYQGLIEVEFEREHNNLVVKVRDNGVGVSADKLPADPATGDGHTSLSTVITKERLQLLNKRKLRKISFHISPVEPKGTLITFSIPL